MTQFLHRCRTNARHGSRPDWFFILFSAEMALGVLLLTAFGVLVVLRFFHII